MRLWNVRKLAAALRAGEVSERQQLHYVLAGIAFVFLLSDYFWQDLEQWTLVNEWDGVSSCLSFAIWTIGTMACYKVSASSPGAQGFLVRYTCLAIPICVQIAVAMVATTLLLVWSDGVLSSWPGYTAYKESANTTEVDVAIYAASEVAYFLYLRAAFRWSYA